MDRIFFAFPEERQKALSLLQEDFIFSRMKDYTFFSGNKNKNPKNPVNPV
jgi:hypothetical protein